MKKEDAIAYLCEKLDTLVYYPVNEFIKTINSEGKSYSFETLREFFKKEIEKLITQIDE